MSTHQQLPARPISITGVGLWKPISPCSVYLLTLFHAAVYPRLRFYEQCCGGGVPRLGTVDMDGYRS